LRASFSLFEQSRARSEGIAAGVDNGPLIYWGRGSYKVWDKQQIWSKFQDMATKF
jgi:hypothetical protein